MPTLIEFAALICRRLMPLLHGGVALLLLGQVGATSPAQAQGRFNGLGSELGNLYRLSDAETRSISPENFSGAKGQGGRATEGTARSAARSRAARSPPAPS